MDVNKTINTKKLFISILIVLSVFICLTSVAAQDSADANLTQASVDEVSQVSEDLEVEIEESASEPTSNGNDLAISSASDEKETPQDKLGATNSKEPLGNIIPVPTHTFSAIQTAINDAQSGDTIFLQPGTYYNEWNGQIFIYNENITIVGNSTILDAQYQSQIFYICESKNVTIRNITFKNGYADMGGAIYWENCADGSVSGCSFVNNTARLEGGAIYWGCVGGSVSGCSFVNNAASFGGAIQGEGSDGGSVSGCSFVNNTADYNGGAIFWNAENGKVSGCSFVNNTADYNGGAILWNYHSNGQIYNSIFVNNNANYGVIHFHNYGSSNNLTINNNIFLNNSCGSEISSYQSDNASNIDFNWFGNNAIDYASQPKTTNIVPNNWLYLNATANPNVLTSLDPTDITFDLFVYSNATGQTDGKYNSSLLMPVNLTVNAANGNVSKNVTTFGETITYTPAGPGKSSVTAQIENAKQTVEIPLKGDFDLLQELIDNASANSVINLTRNYTYNNLDTMTDGVVIRNSNVTINGNGYTIDAKDKSRIFNIANSKNVKIQNITFKNGHAYYNYYNSYVDGYGGAIYWYYSAGGCVSNCSFVNNTAGYGGAIRFDYCGGVVSDCSFVNNTASANGGAINQHYGVGGVVSGCSFVNNTADRGGAIFWFHNDGGIVSGCSFVNNTYKGKYYISSAAIDWYGDEGSISGCIFIKHNERDNVIYFSNGYGYGNLTINYNIFLDNACPNEIYFDESDDSSNIDFNWFGNNATDYASQPITVNVVPNNWLYLNATASPSELSLLDSSDITFDLFVYSNATGSTEGKFNASLLMPVNLTVTAANGNVNKNAIQFGEKITYTPDKAGNASVTASIENVHQTIELEVVKGNLTLNATCDSIYYGDNATIVVSGFADATGEARAYVGDGLYCATIENGIATFNVPGVIENTTATINYFGDGNYNNASTEVLIIVGPKHASVSVANDTMELNVDSNDTIIATTSPDGLNVTFASSNESVATVDNNGNVVAVSTGTATITVSVGDDVTYAKNSTTVDVTVTKIPTEITVSKDSFDLKVIEGTGHFANLTPGDAGALNYTSSNESVAVVMFGSIFGVGEGTAVITVSFAGNDKYAAAENKTIKVTVTLWDASVSVENDTMKLFVGENGTIVATTNPEGLTVNYTSSDESVVTVDAQGNVEAIGEGSAVITVSVGNGEFFAYNSTEVSVTVSKIPTEIILTNDTLDLKVNDIVEDVVYLTPAEAGNLTYVSSNENITLAADGMILARGKGSATVTVSFAGNDKYAAALNKTINVNVSLRDARVSVENDTVDLKVDDRYDLNATAVPRFLNVDYVSSDESVATVTDYGIVTAVGEGTCVITLTVGNNVTFAVNSTNVTVKVSKIPTEITASTASELYVGDKSIIAYHLTPDDAVGEFTFTSNNTDAVTVNQDGVVEAVGEGSALITVDFSGNEKYCLSNATVTVRVSKFGSKVTIEPIGNATYGEDVTVEYSIENRTGNVGVIVEDSEGSQVSDYNIIITDDAVSISGLDAGDYTITIINYADGKTKESNASALFGVSKFSPSLSVEVSDITYGEVEVITITCDVPGTVNVTVNGITETLELNGESKEILFAAFSNILKSENKATLSLYNLKAGQYPVEVVYNGNENYESVAKSDEFTVDSVNASISVDSSDIQVGDDETITVTLPDDATGNVTVEIDGANYTQPVENGKAVVPIHDLSAGNKTAKIYYSGDDKYNPSETNASFTVSKVKPDISIQNATINDDGRIVVILPEDATGTVTITIDGENHTVPVENGKAVFDIQGLSEGKHDIKVYYSGDDKYEAVEFDASITVEGNGTNPENRTVKTVNKASMATGTTDEATGNPILMLLVALIAIGSTALRRLKK